MYCLTSLVGEAAWIEPETFRSKFRPFEAWAISRSVLANRQILRLSFTRLWENTDNCFFSFQTEHNFEEAFLFTLILKRYRKKKE